MNSDLDDILVSALHSLDNTRKAAFLLDTALSLIDAGKYGDQVEKYLDVFLKTPNLPKSSVAKALLARANARKACGEKLLQQAQQDFQAVLRLDPSNKAIQHHLRRRIAFSSSPPAHRTPPELWSRIASYIPRYHLRTWLSLSSFHRQIALPHLFRTLDLYFGEDQPEIVSRSLDIFDRIKNDKHFSSLIKCLRVHWAYEEGELLDLMIRVFRTALPEFIALEEFEWIGYPELRADMVSHIYSTHPTLRKLAMIGFHFDACGISRFTSLQKFTLRAEDDDGYGDMSEITTLLTLNNNNLKHLILGAYLHRQHSWDNTFTSPTISKLVKLDLVDTRISHVVLSRIVHAAGGVNGQLEELTLHGILEEPEKAAVVFGSDELIGGVHTIFPRLKSFRFLLVGQPQPQPQPPQNQPQQQNQQQPHQHESYTPSISHLYRTITHFLRDRKSLRKLDLGACPWDLVKPILGGLTGLRVLGVRVGCLSSLCNGGLGVPGIPVPVPGITGAGELEQLVRLLPKQMHALRVEVGISEVPLHLYAQEFSRFHSLSFLHIILHTDQLVPHQHQYQYQPQYPYGYQQHQQQLYFPPLQVSNQGYGYAQQQVPAPLQNQPPIHGQGYPYPGPQGQVQQYQAYHQQYPQSPPSGPSILPPQQFQLQQPPMQNQYQPFPQQQFQSYPPPALIPAAPSSSTSTSSGPTSASTGNGQPGTPKRRTHPHTHSHGSRRDLVDSDHSGGNGSVVPPQQNPQTPQHQQPQSQQNQNQQPGLGRMLPPLAPVPGPQPSQFQQPLSQPQPLPTSTSASTPAPVQVQPPSILDNHDSAAHIARNLSSLDFVGWNGELYVIVRSSSKLASRSRTSGGGEINTNVMGMEVVREMIGTPGPGASSRAASVVAGTSGSGSGSGGQGRVSRSPVASTSGSAVPASSSESSGTAPPTANANASTNTNTTPPPVSQSIPPSSSSASTSSAHNEIKPLRATSSSSPDLRTPTPAPPSTSTSTSGVQVNLNPNINGTPAMKMVEIELKELPPRRRLDCGKGVDLGSDDAFWLERKDVPMDYDVPVVPES